MYTTFSNLFLKYVHDFLHLCYYSNIDLNSYDVFTHIVLGCFNGTEAIYHCPSASEVILKRMNKTTCTKSKLEQLERLLMIHIGSQVKTRCQIHKFKEFAKISNFEINLMRNTPSEVV